MKIAKTATDDELLLRLKTHVIATATGLVEVGAILAALEERGRDVSAFTGPYFTWARDVHARIVHPQAALGAGVSPDVYAAIKRIPFDLQVEALQGRVTILRGSKTQKVAIWALSRSELDLLIDPAGNVRSVAEQTAVVQNSRPARKVTPNRNKTLFLSFTPEEYEAFVQHARQRVVTPVELAAQIIAASGMLSGATS